MQAYQSTNLLQPSRCRPRRRVSKLSSKEKERPKGTTRQEEQVPRPGKEKLEESHKQSKHHEVEGPAPWSRSANTSTMEQAGQARTTWQSRKPKRPLSIELHRAQNWGLVRKHLPARRVPYTAKLRGNGFSSHIKSEEFHDSLASDFKKNETHLPSLWNIKHAKHSHLKPANTIAPSTPILQMPCFWWWKRGIQAELWCHQVPRSGSKNKDLKFGHSQWNCGSEARCVK